MYSSLLFARHARDREKETRRGRRSPLQDLPKQTTLKTRDRSPGGFLFLAVAERSICVTLAQRCSRCPDVTRTCTQRSRLFRNGKGHAPRSCRTRSGTGAHRRGEATRTRRWLAIERGPGRVRGRCNNGLIDIWRPASK